MAFLSGSIGFERFQVASHPVKKFGQKHLEILANHAAGQIETFSEDNIHVGFLGGSHLFDTDFYAEKNIINQALHCGVRIDTNQVPGAIRNAWMQMELAAAGHDMESGRPTKAQRHEAKEAVDQRCADELRTGKYLRMQQCPALWDAQTNFLYFGTSSAAANGHCADLFERAFGIELDRVTAGTIATYWAEEADRQHELAEAGPAPFHIDHEHGGIAWLHNDPNNFDFLGNEFVLWLWWYLETQSDTLRLADESSVTLMMTKTLSLECPLGEWGKEALSAESPVKMPEAIQAIRSGKLPRKAGITMVRDGVQFEFTLQAETLSISGAKVQADEAIDNEQDRLDGRIEAIRTLSDSVDLMFESFCERRISKKWPKELEQIQQWLDPSRGRSKRKSA